MFFVVSMERQPDLFEIVLAPIPSSIRTSVVNGREQQRSEDRGNRQNDQAFN
jgi:hypothetical protein